MADIYPVILSGGSGTRLWPLSRAMFPKQFIGFFGDGSSSFLAQTLKRLPQSDGFKRPVILCNNDHRFLVREELVRAHMADCDILLEPVARNTAPAIAVAALHVTRTAPDAVLAVMPSDHVIQDGASFALAVKAAGDIAAKHRLVLFGITPDSPHTGYGYIRRGSPVAGTEAEAFDLAGFTEKPKRDVAEGYLKTKEYYWNSGIFVLHARTFLNELGRLSPKILEAAQKALAGATTDLGFLRLDEAAFATAPSISIDYAVMEKTSAAAMLPLSVGWSDVGAWGSLWDVAQKDKDGNASVGDVMVEATHNTFVHSSKGLVATLGVDNLVIVNTPDALLVADRSRSEEVGAIVSRLKLQGRKEHAQHIRNHRPWGFFDSLSQGGRFQVKMLHVKPGAKLSKQMHHHRSEHWVVVQGTAKVLIGETEKLVSEGESVYIFATQWHRLENPGKVPLEVIEVQIGSYFGEDDIVRTDDVYQRRPDETK